MQKLGDELNETMFVISQLEFSDYLKKPAYAAAARLLPKPETLSPHLRRGDFDLLVIHRSFGILVGELKALGLSAADAQKSQAESDADLVNRLERAVKQLAKSDTVLRHLTADVAPSVMIRMTVILPYVPLSQLQRDLCACLGAKDETEACQLSLCAEQFSSRQDPLHVDQQTLNQLKTWWSLRMARTQDPCMSSDVYLDLLARFCGPATSVTVFCPEPPRLELRTEGEAVSEVGRRLAHIVLTLQQVDLLHRAERLVCVTGPPGTGKSLLLVLMGLKWLRRGKDVHVVSTKFASFAASRLIEEQLKKTLSEAEVEPGQVLGTVHFHHFDFWNRDGDIDNAIRVLKAEAKDSELYVLMDEVSANQDKFAQMYGRLVSELGQSVQDLHIWAAAIRSGKLPPAFHVESVTVALRCTPAVLQEITWVLDKKGWAGIHKYDSISVRHLPTVGPGVKHLSHEGPGHSGDWPTYCVQCGKAVISDYTAGEDCLMPDLSVVAQSENDKVLVGRYGELCGLERKVVVSLGGRSEKYDGKRTDEELDEHHRVFAMSRIYCVLFAEREIPQWDENSRGEGDLRILPQGVH
nr:hypothetical protein BaRGS_020774 [Batillaria attramentaria]